MHERVLRQLMAGERNDLLIPLYPSLYFVSAEIKVSELKRTRAYKAL